MNAQRSTLNAQRSSANGAYDLEDRLLEYAVRIIRVAESMRRSAAGLHIADQLVRSGTSPYGNHVERLKARVPRQFHSQTACLLQGTARVTALVGSLVQRAELIENRNCSLV
jgi:four helix bundle protein